MAVITEAATPSQDTVLVELAARYIDTSGLATRPFEVGPEARGADNRLSFSDLVGDGRGEIVIEPSGGPLVLEVEEGAVLIRQGISSAHVTSSGDEVGGLSYLCFESGLTIYYPASMELSLTPAAQG